MNNIFNDKRKLFGTILGIILFGLTVVSITFAYYSWRSSNTDVTFSISDSTFTCETDLDSSISSLAPVTDYRNGTHQVFSVKNIGRSDTTFSLTMNISSISDVLKHPSFKYKLMLDPTNGSRDCSSTSVNNCELVGEGSFENVSVGMNTLVQSINLPNNSRYRYYFFMYLDGNMSNPTGIQNGTMTSSLGVCDIYTALNLNTTCTANVSVNCLKLAADSTYGNARACSSPNGNAVGLPTPSRNSTVISYDSNASGITNPSNQTITYTSSWNDKADGTGATYTNNTAVTKTENHTLYAKWTPSTTSVTLPGIGSRTGYVFDGWYTQATGGTKVGNANATYTVPVTSCSHTLHARWIANSKTISIRKDNSAWSGSNMKISLSTSNTTNTDTFTTTASGNTVTFTSNETTNIVAGTTYYVWIGKDANHKTDMVYSGVSFKGLDNTSPIVNYYTLTVNGTNVNSLKVNGNAVSNVVVASGFAHAITGSVVNGYTFSSWSKTAGNGTVSFGNANQITTTATVTVNSATITANATPNTYKIVLDNQSATTAGTTEVWYQYKTTKQINNETCYYYTNSTLTNCLTGYTITKPTKTGYTYGGYYTAVNGGGTNYVNTNGVFINNIYQKLPSEINSSYTNTITLYAKWTINSYTLTYDCTTNGGTTANSTQNYNYNASVNLTKSCTKSGWTHVGWAESSSATTKLNSYNMPAHDQTLYAIYKKAAIVRKITFNPNGNTSFTYNGTRKTATTTYDACTIPAVYNTATQATSCSATITMPTIEAPANTPTVKGWSTGATTYSGYLAAGSSQTITFDANKTYYAQTEKGAVDGKVTFNPNGNTKFTYNGTDYTTTTAIKICTIAATHNRVAQASTCSAAITMPTITPSPNTPTVCGWTNATGTHTGCKTGSQTITSGTTWYAQSSKAAVDGNVTFKLNNNTNFIGKSGFGLGTTTYTADKTVKICTIAATYNGTAQAATCTASGTMPTITAPTNTPTVIGWSNAQNTHTATYTSGQANVTLTSGTTWWAQSQATKKDGNVTFKLNNNTNFIGKSGFGLGTTTYTADKTIKICDIAATYNGTAQAATCTASGTMPKITAPSNTPTVIGWSNAQNTHTATYTSEQANVTLTSGTTWWAQSKKGSVAGNVTFKLNNNTNFIGKSGFGLGTTTYTADKTVQICTIAETYNGVAQATTCTASGTMPKITAPSNTPTVIGWSNAQNTHTATYTSEQANVTLTSGTTWWAQSKKGSVAGNVTFKLNNNTNFIGKSGFGLGTTTYTADKTVQICTIAETYNGVAQAATCTASGTMPKITASSNTPTVIGWSNGPNTHTATYTSEQTNVTLTSGTTWWAQSQATKKDGNVTFKLNNNTNFIGKSGFGLGTTTYTADKTIKICTIAATYNGTAQAATCTASGTMPKITAPSNTPTVIGWSNAQNTHTATYTSEQTNVTLTSGTTWWTQTTKAAVDGNVTFKLNNNTNFIGKSGFGLGTTTYTADKTIKICTIAATYNGTAQAATCTASGTMPKITAPSNTPTVIGWSNAQNTHTATYTSEQANVTLTSGTTWWAQSKKGSVAGNVTFKLNNNTNFIGKSGFGLGTTTYTADKTVQICTIAETYNGVAQAATCTASGTMPKITAPSNTPTVIGWSNAQNTHTATYTSEQANVTLTSGTTWWAQSKKGSVAGNVTFKLNNNTNFIGKSGFGLGTTTYTADKTVQICMIAETYNGVAQATTCTANGTMPTITAPSNTPTVIGWSNAQTTHTATYTSEQTNVTLTSGTTWYAQTSGDGNVTFYPNGNTKFTYNSTAYTATTSIKICTKYNGEATCNAKIKMPSITAHSNTTRVIGWSNAASNHTATYTSGQSNVTLTSGSKWYAQTSGTGSVTFNPNGNTKFTYNSTDYMETTSINICTKYNGAATCRAIITMPTITPPNTTPNVCGWTNGPIEHNGCKTGSQSITSGTTWYAQTYMDEMPKYATFYANGNSRFTYDGTVYTSSANIQVCTVPAAWNGAAHAGACSGTITMPTITAPANTPTVCGWTNAAGTHTGCKTGSQTIVSGTSWYAQTKNNTDITVTFVKNGASTQTNASGTAVSNDAVTRSCTRYNGASVCSITSPTIVAASGFDVVGYNTSASATISSWNHNTAKTVIVNATYYAITRSTSQLTATIYYNSNTTCGSLTVATDTTAKCYKYNGASSCNVSIPSTVSGSKGKYNSTYKGVATALSSMSSNTSISLSSNTTYYTVYSQPLTIYYPNTSGGVSSSNNSLYRNEYFTSTTVMGVVPSNGTTQATNSNVSLPNLKGAFAGINGTVNSNAFASVSASGVVKSCVATYYAGTTMSEHATIYYNSNTNAGSITPSTANVATSCSYYCKSTSEQIAVHGTSTTVPTAVSNSVGKWDTPFNGIAANINSMTAVTTFTGGQEYYAFYGGGKSTGGEDSRVLEYYYNGTRSTNRTLFRNEFFASKTGIHTVLSNSTTGTTDISTSNGINNSFWYGYAVSNNTTRIYNSVAAAANSNSRTLYSIYKYNVSYSDEGAHVASVGKASDSCLMKYNDTSCTVVAPTIAVTDVGYVQNGWSTSLLSTLGNTASGIAVGDSITLTTNNQTYYANAKRSFACGTAGSTTTYKGKSWYTVANNADTCELVLNDVVSSGVYSPATGTSNPSYDSIKSYSDDGGTIAEEIDGNVGLITSLDSIPNTSAGLDNKYYWISSGKIFVPSWVSYTYNTIYADFGFHNKVGQSSGMNGHSIHNSTNPKTNPAGLVNLSDSSSTYTLSNGKQSSATKTYGYSNKYSMNWSVWGPSGGNGTSSKVRLVLETGSFTDQSVGGIYTRTATSWIKAIVCGGQYGGKTVTWSPVSSTKYHYKYTGTGNNQTYSYNENVYAHPSCGSGVSGCRPDWTDGRNFTFAGSASANPYTDAQKKYDYNAASNCTTYKEFTISDRTESIHYRPHIIVKK